MSAVRHGGLLLALLSLPAVAEATDLYRADSFAALASDQTARAVGDLVTIVVFENASASNSATTNTKKNSSISGRITASGLDEGGSLGFGGSSDNAGSIGRSGKMVAQISATVEEVLPNGDLRISGEQELDIGGERSHIRVKGRVRRADISASNAILSSRLADARIEYNGKGFASRGARPGVVTRIFNWLGLL